MIADEQNLKPSPNDGSFLNCTMSTTNEGKIETIQKSIKTNKDFAEQKLEFK